MSVEGLLGLSGKKELVMGESRTGKLQAKEATSADKLRRERERERGERERKREHLFKYCLTLLVLLVPRFKMDPPPLLTSFFWFIFSLYLTYLEMPCINYFCICCLCYLFSPREYKAGLSSALGPAVSDLRQVLRI